MELEFNVIIDAVKFGKKKIIVLDVSDDNTLEAAQLTAALGQSISVMFKIPEVIRD